MFQCFSGYFATVGLRILTLEDPRPQGSKPENSGSLLGTRSPSLGTEASWTDNRVFAVRAVEDAKRGLKDRNQRTQDPFWNHGHHPLERKPHGPIIEFLFLKLDRLCRLTSMQIGATGPRTQGTKETLGEHRDLGRSSGSRNVWFLQY